MLEPEFAPVPKQAQEVSGVASASDDHDVLDAGVDKRPDRVVDHRLVIDRQQVLVDDPSDGIEAASQAPSQDYAPHKLLIVMDIRTSELWPHSAARYLAEFR